MLLGTLDTSLLGNLLTSSELYRAGKGKGAIATSQGRGINRAGEGVLRAGYGNKADFSYCFILSLILKYKNIIKMN